MKTKIHLFLALLTGICAGPASAQIHTVASGLDPAWATAAWAGLKISQADIPPGRALSVEVTPGAQAWSGIVIAPNWNQQDLVLPVTPEDVANGALLLEINGGKTATGEERGGQKLQFSVIMADASRAALEGTGAYLGFDQVSESDQVDADPATWQKIRIPLARCAGTQAAKVTGIKKIGIQFVGEAPSAGYFIRNIRLESSGEAPAAPAAPVGQLTKPKLIVTANHPDWNYREGEPIVFHVAFSAEQPITNSYEVRYRVGPEKFEGSSKTVTVPPEGLDVAAENPNSPGFIRLSATAFVSGKELKGMASAAVSPEKLRPTQTEPSDFDAFWNATKAELAKIPMDPVLVEKPELSGESWNAFELSLPNYDPNGEKPRFYGILCVPKGPGPFPAILQTPGAGVRSYKGEIWVPRDQFITLEVGIHGIPVTEPAKFYEDQANGPLKDYATRNLSDRDKFYYRRVYAGVMRSLDYLTSHPKWDHKNLVIRGGSQGGQLAIVGAALEPRVTAVAASFPAWCDVTGYTVGRAGGWPGLFTDKPAADADAKARHAAQLATTGYYDTVNFAKRLRVPGFFAWGYNDEVCPPTSLFAMYSAITSPKELHIYKEAGHNLPDNGWGAYTNWVVSKAKGK